MKQTINFSEFHDGFIKCNRTDNFSYLGLRALFDYFEQLEDDCGVEIEFDVISLCCEFSEDTVKNVLENYKLESLEELKDHTQVIEVDSDLIIYQNY